MNWRQIHVNNNRFDTLRHSDARTRGSLEALVEGATITAAAERGGVHRSTVHLWTRNHPAFARTLLAARQDRAETLMDELTDLSKLACDTFRQILSDPAAPASTRLKAAMEIVKLVQSQQPTDVARHKLEQHFDKVLHDFDLAQVATATTNVPHPSETTPSEPAPEPILRSREPVRNSPCPCGSRLKYKRCCGNPVTQARAA